MSAAVHDDELFKQIVCQTWNVKDDLAEPAPLHLMSLSSPSTRKSSTDILSRYGDQNDFETHSTGMLKVTATEVSIASRGPHAPNKASDSAVPPVNLCKQPNPALGYLMQKLRSELKVRIGGTGFLALQRKFREVKSDSSPFVIIAEFRKSLLGMEVSLSDHEIRSMFSHLDTENLSQVHYMNFIDSLCGAMSERRQRIVDIAFSLIDVDGSGSLSASEFGSRYDPTRHPEVLAGRNSSREVLSQVMYTVQPPDFYLYFFF